MAADRDPIRFIDRTAPETVLETAAPVEVEQDIIAPAPKPKRAGKTSADGYQPFNW